MEVITNYSYVYIHRHTSHFFLLHLVYFLIFFVARRRIFNNDCTNLSPLYLPSIVDSPCVWPPAGFCFNHRAPIGCLPFFGHLTQQTRHVKNPRRRVQGLQGTSMNPKHPSQQKQAKCCLHCGKLTWQWKNRPHWRCMIFVNCYVGFLEYIYA